MLRIKELRAKLGISQTELAELIRVNQTAISQWERGVVNPSLANARKLADVFGCTMDELLLNQIK